MLQLQVFQDSSQPQIFIDGGSEVRVGFWILKSRPGADKNSVPCTRALQWGWRLSVREARAEVLQLKDGLFLSTNLLPAVKCVPVSITMSPEKLLV